MADNNRNRQDSYRQQYDWNEDSGRQNRTEDEPNYSVSENRGHRDSGRYSGMGSGEGGWQSRYERQMNTNREGDYSGGYNQRQQGRQQESDYNYGGGQRGMSSAFSDFGGDYSRGTSRNLYDRGNQGMGRRDYENQENRIGGANYDRYGDQGRYDQGQSFRGGHGGFSSGSSYGNSDWGQSSYGNRSSGDRDYERSDWRNRDYGRSQRDYGRSERDYGRGDSEERSWWDRTTDEVSSWFGDRDAERRREQDRNYRGKGPKNYSRSDERIKEDINDRLSDDPFIDASDIDVTVSSGEVTLTGTVDHRSTKRRAEDLAEAVSGVKNVENRLRVMQSTGSSSGSSFAGSQTSGVSSMSNPTGSTGSQSSSPIPGSDRGRKETTTNK